MKDVNQLIHSYFSSHHAFNSSEWVFGVGEGSNLYKWGGVVYLTNPVRMSTGEETEVMGFKPLFVDFIEESVECLSEWPLIDLDKYIQEYCKSKGYDYVRRK